MKRFFLLSLVSTLSVGVFAQAGARYKLAKGIYENPSILVSPEFWCVVGFIVVCAIIYLICKDKEK